VKTEDDPLDDDMPASASQAAAAMRHVDEVVTAAGGVALRYGAFYGNPDDAALEPVRRRLWPIVDGGDGMTSFVHLDDAAAATVLAIESDVVGVYNVVDDEPAAGRDWLPAMAEVLGVKPPRHVPRWLARLVAGEAVAVMGTEARGASNAKAKRELGWVLRYPTWRTGFAAALGSGLAAA
jgi:nucleoside-diphosphate-sugar epimerase